MGRFRNAFWSLRQEEKVLRVGVNVRLNRSIPVGDVWLLRTGASCICSKDLGRVAWFNDLKIEWRANDVSGPKGGLT